MTRLLLLPVLALAACADGDAPLPPEPVSPVPELAAAPEPPAVASAAEAAAPSGEDAARPTVTLYKSPTCGCCAAWGDHMREAGFPVEVVDADMDAVKREYGIPPALQSCHTAVVDGYVVEGHVPAADVERLLAEAPEAGGLAVPGMPVGSPGMERGDTVQPYKVFLIDDGQRTVFASHGADAPRALTP